MRKRDPNAVIDSFHDDLAHGLEQHRAVSSATSHLPAKVRGGLAQSSFLNLAIRFERFRHDWHMAAIARDASVLRDFLAAEARRIIGGSRHIKGIKDLVRVDLPRHPTIAELELLLQPDGKTRPPSLKHVSSSSPSNWTHSAQRELSEPYRSAILSLSTADLKFASLIEAMRDCIVHGSFNAEESMRSALVALDIADRRNFGVEELGRSTVARYLRASVAGTPRVMAMHDRLDQFAEGMRR